MPGVMSAEDMANVDFDKFDFSDSKFGMLIGDPARPFYAMFWGKPGQGKSTAVLQLSRYFASVHGTVLYVSGEEYGSATLKMNLNRQGGPVPGLYFGSGIDAIGPISGPSGRFTPDVVVLDSITSLDMKIEEFRALKKAHPSISFVLIFQSTKAGQFKGENTWSHEVQTVIEVDGGIAKTNKNRFKELTETKIF